MTRSLSDCEIQLRNNVDGIAEDIKSGQYETSSEEGCSAWDYLENALDIEYTISSRRNYLGARILMAFGGPNIYIDTRHKQVEGFWGGDQYVAYYSEDKLDLDSYLEECFNSF